MNRLKKYLNLIAEQLSINANISGLTNNTSDIGTNRELIVKEFLSKHLPKRLYPILGGYVFGMDSESKQIDILIVNDISINFETSNKMFIAAESLVAAFSIKSMLNKEALEESILNLSSIPNYNNQILKFRGLKVEAQNAFVTHHPAFFLFAFDGFSLESCLEHLNNLKVKYSNFPSNRLPRGIIVNKKYYIMHRPEASKSIAGQTIPANTFYPIPLNDEMYGYPFIQILNDILSYVDWLPYMRIDFHHYFNRDFDLN